MRISNKQNQLPRGAQIVALLLLTLVIPTLGARSNAQTTAQTPAPATSATTAEKTEAVPVAKEVQAMKAQIAQLQSQLNYLTSSVAAPIRPVPLAPAEVSLTGKVSCAHCEGIQPLHKGYTQFSWALYSVSQGDDIVLVTRDKTYKLQGNKDQLLKLMCDKAKVTGRLEGTTVDAETIGRAAKNE